MPCTLPETAIANEFKSASICNQNWLPDADRLTIGHKVEFLSNPKAYPYVVKDISRRETHMSWLFFAGAQVYKLKKPVRFSYLDFSTLERRAAACRAELVLNRRLAPDVYKAVVPLVWSRRGLTIGGPGKIVDWLVVMRRLDETETLEHALLTEHGPTLHQLDCLIAKLAAFYRHAPVIFLAAAAVLAEWDRSLICNRTVLLDPRLGMAQGLVRRIDRIQRRFLTECSGMIVDRVRRRHLVDGHGDLRPEHIWLGGGVRVIDCLEFSTKLRSVDPLDELAFLCLECERLGSNWAGTYIRKHAQRALWDTAPEELFVFYRCHRATLRARLAIAHLLGPAPDTRRKWPNLARSYLGLAVADAIRLERLLRR
jgi:aminoglycoside phosphotransferase family enzyme